MSTFGNLPFSLLKSLINSRDQLIIVPTNVINRSREINSMVGAGDDDGGGGKQEAIESLRASDLLN